MRHLFYKWMKNLIEMDIQNLCSMYTSYCTICSIENKKEDIYQGKVGIIEKYDDILFRNSCDFNIIKYEVVYRKNERRLESKYRYILGGNIYDLDDIMILVNEKGDLKINYHRTILTK